jgi:hypothetical protein
LTRLRRWYARAPTEEEIARLTRTIERRVLRLLRRRGRITEDDELTSDDPLASAEPLLARCSAASVRGRNALAPWDSRPQRLDLLGRPVPSSLGRGTQTGFDLHADVLIPAGDRARLEHLCRYVARPAIAQERLSETPDGRIALELRRPWADGTTHVVFEPLEFIARLAVLVPAPRAHLVHYHGLLAPHARRRATIVPSAVASSHPEAGARGEPEAAPSPPPQRRHPWADLIWRVFAIDVLRCDECGGRRRVIASITERSVMTAILDAMGLPTEPPRLHPARSPPQCDLEWDYPSEWPGANDAAA